MNLCKINGYTFNIDVKTFVLKLPFVVFISLAIQTRQTPSDHIELHPCRAHLLRHAPIECRIRGSTVGVRAVCLACKLRMQQRKRENTYNATQTPMQQGNVNAMTNIFHVRR